MEVLDDLAPFRISIQPVIISSGSLVSCCTSRISSLLSFIRNIRCRPLETSPTSNRSSTPLYMLPPASAADSERIQSCLSLRVTESKSSAARICEHQRSTRAQRWDTIAAAWTSIWYVSAAVRYLSLLFGPAISRMSEKRSMSALEAEATAEMSFVVRTAVGGGWPWLDAIQSGENSLVVSGTEWCGLSE
jgi:hypothetical protein